MDAREERLACNEILFREISESIEVVAQSQGAGDHVFDFMCECTNVDCTLSLPLALAVYEDTRGAPDLFLVAPGHDLPEIEDIVQRGDGYQVVRERGDVARFAAERHPRG